MDISVDFAPLLDLFLITIDPTVLLLLDGLW